MIAWLHALAWAPLRARLGRSMLAVLAIAVGVALGLAVNLVNEAALGEMQQAFRTVAGDADVRIEAVVRGTGRGIDESLYGTLGMRAEVETIAPIIEAEVAVPGRREMLKVIGLDPFASAKLTPQLLARPGAGARGEHDPMRQFGTQVALSPAALTWLENGVPGSVKTFTIHTASGSHTVSASGTLAGIDTAQRLAVMDIALAQELLGMRGLVSRLDLRLQGGVDRAAFARQLGSQLPPGVHAVLPEVREAQAANMSRAYRLNLTMLAMIALFSGCLLVFSTQMLSVAERRSELAFLRVVGVTQKETVRLMLFEALALGLGGALLGVVLGYGLAWAALHVLGGDLGAGFFHGSRPALPFAPGTTLTFAALGVAAALAGAWLPAREAALAQPAQALKSGALHDSQSREPSSLVGLGLCLLGAVLAFVPAVRGIPAFGYAAILSLLIGAIMLTPALAALAFRAAQRLLGAMPHAPVMLQLATQRLANAPAQAGISLASVLAAVSLAAAMAIMVHSFRHSVEDWLEQVLPAPAYLRQAPASQTRSEASFDVAAQAVIRATPGITSARFVRTEALLLDPARPPVALVIREFGESVQEQPDRQLPLVARAAPSTEKSDATPVWVSESFIDLHRERLDLTLGGSFDLPLPVSATSTIRAPVRVAGIWRDYARQHGTVLMRAGDFTRLTGDARMQDAALWYMPGNDSPAVLARLKARLPQATDLHIIESADVRRLSLSIFDRTFAVTYALEAVAVLIGLAGMAAAFMGLILARRREFGMLRHLGVTSRELKRTIALEGASLAALGAALGLVLGVILAAILVFVINVQSFGWSMDFRVPAVQLSGFAILLVGAATLAAWLTAQRVIGARDLVRSVREDW